MEVLQPVNTPSTPPPHPLPPDQAPPSTSEVLPKATADRLVREYQACRREQPGLAVATVAIRALTALIVQSDATTMMGLEKEIKELAAALQKRDPGSISLKAGCDLFLRYATRTSAIESDEPFALTKARLIERGNHFAATSAQARAAIAELGARFVLPNSTVLCHGSSRVVLDVLRAAARAGVHFTVLVTEGRPHEAGLRVARALSAAHVHVQVISDAAVAYFMDRVDLALVGAEAVVESGGIINTVGTYQLALCAAATKTPLYVAAESYKFARLFPLSQEDVPAEVGPLTEITPLLPSTATSASPLRDYTPPGYIALLITDLGILTPAAVSDELIQLYI